MGSRSPAQPASRSSTRCNRIHCVARIALGYNLRVYTLLVSFGHLRPVPPSGKYIRIYRKAIVLGLGPSLHVLRPYC
jgi:hypothetical protein